MRQVISFVIYIFRNEKKKILFFFMSVALFVVVLFPFSDVGDLVTAQISKATNNQIFVQFQDPGISIFPEVGFELNQVHVETNFLPPLKAQSLTISPSIIGFLTLKPGVKISASKILGGDIDLSLQQIKVSGKMAQLIQVDGDGVELSEILNLASMKLPIKGKVNLDTSAEIEPTFSEQPTGRVQMSIDRFDLSSETIATPLGPLNLPPLSLKQVNLTGNLNEGRLNIEQLVAGQGTDELTANVKGRLDLRMQPSGGGAQLQPGPFDLEIRISTKDSFEKKAGIFLSFLSAYKKAGPAGTTLYEFRLRGQNFYGPPVPSAL